MTGIRFENVSKMFGDVVVVEGLALTIRDGEFFTFVGPSGCGKSTLINMIAGLEPVSGGRILFDDAEVNELSPRERDVAMVFQSYALYPHMTVRENIAFPLKMKKASKETIESEVKRVASILGLEDLLHRKPKELSGGQRQRVALGRAIIRRPRVFLMDEPLSNLDARLRVEMRGELKRLHRELGITTVYVTHDQAEAMSLSDRIAVIHQGNIQQCGAPSEVYSKPANTFVAAFIGSLPINLIQAAVRRREPPEIDCNGAILAPQMESLPEGERVIVGIRPEDITVSSEMAEGSVEVSVSLVEPAGHCDWIDFLWNGAKCKGSARPDSGIRPGAKAYMAFQEEKAVIFDESGGRV